MNESNEAQDEDINEPEVKREEKSAKKGKKRNNEDKKEEEEEQEEEEEENLAMVPPNGGWGWLVVFCAFYCNVVLDGIQLTFGIFLNAISTEFHVDNSLVVLAGSLMFGIHLLMGPVCSGCNSVFGLRPVTITGSLICCFGVGISYFANGFWYLCFSFGIVGGMGLGLVYMNTLVITSLYFDSLLPIAIAIVVCGTGIGTMVFAALASFLLRLTTWQNSILMEAALAGTMGIAAITFRPLKPVKVKIMSEEGAEVPERRDIEKERGSLGEHSEERRMSLFIKADLMNRGSLVSFRTYQNIAASFAEAEREKQCEWWNRCRCSRCCRKRKRAPERGNVLVLQEIRSDDPKSRRKSYIETSHKLEPEEEEELFVTEQQQSAVSHNVLYTRVEMPKKKIKFWGTLRRTLAAMLDYRLLSSCSFSTFTVSGGACLAAFLMVFIYEKDRCQDLGFSEQVSDNFVIALGAVNVFWRLVLGMIAIIPKIHYRALTVSGMVLGGIGTCVSGYSSNLYFQIAFCFLFGLGMGELFYSGMTKLTVLSSTLYTPAILIFNPLTGSFAVFRMPLVLDLVGPDFLENAAGINLLFMGVFCIIFPPFFGWVKELTNSYNVVFTINGSILVISALVLIRLKKVDISKIKKKNIFSNS